MAKFIWDKELRTMVDENRQPMFSKKDLKKWIPQAPNLVPDIGEFVSPIDDTLISSRSQLKAYEKAHGVIQVGNDFGNIVERQTKKHEEWKATASESGWCEPD